MPRTTCHSCSQSQTIISFSAGDVLMKGWRGSQSASSFAAAVIRLPDSLISRNCRPELFLRSNQKFDCKRITELLSRSSPVLGQEWGSGTTIGWRVCTPDRETGMQFVPQKEGKRKKSGISSQAGARLFDINSKQAAKGSTRGTGNRISCRERKSIP